jgi:hypothetical protein
MTETDWDECSTDEAEAEGRIEEMETDLERDREAIVMASGSGADYGFDRTVLPPVSAALRGWLRSQQAARSEHEIDQWIQNGKTLQNQNGKRTA